MRTLSDHPLMLSSYRGESAARRKTPTDCPPPGPLGPALSIIPGLICWVLFAAAAMPHELSIMDRLADLFGGRATNGLIVVAWAIAVATSLFTLTYYARRPRAWYTTLCLSVHLAGLFFSTLLLGGLVVLLVA